MFQTAFNPLSPKNRYSSPHLAPTAAQPTGSFFSQRPSGNPMKLQRIPALRHKLREAGVAGEPIRTHHGLGYSFAESWCSVFR